MNYTKGEWKPYLIDKEPKRWAICAGEGGEKGITKTILDDDISPAEREANARLISAAPDMHQYLQIAVDLFKASGLRTTDPVVDNFINVSEKILAKAEGGS